MFNNQSFIEKLPLNLFCPIVEITDALAEGRTVQIKGLPGFGKDILARQASLLLERRHPKISQIFLDLELCDNPDEKLLNTLKKLAKTRTIDETKLKEFLVEHRVVVILFNNTVQTLGSLEKIHENNRRNIPILEIKTINDKLLFSNKNNIVKLKNLQIGQVQKIISLCNEEYHWNIDTTLAQKILFLSGGNFELIKEICITVSERGEEILSKPSLLKTNPNIQQILFNLSRLSATLNMHELLEWGIILSNGTLFSKLFEKYLNEYEIAQSDILFSELTSKDRQILSIFINNPNTVISKEQISIILTQNADNDSGWAIYKAVERLKNKVKKQYPISMKKGLGWILEAK